MDKTAKLWDLNRCGKISENKTMSENLSALCSKWWVAQQCCGRLCLAIQTIARQERVIIIIIIIIKNECHNNIIVNRLQGCGHSKKLQGR